MPGSSNLGKLYTAMMLKKLHDAGSIERVVDFGCGRGTYKDLLGPHCPGTHWTCVEIWKPYVEQFGLEQKYDRVLVEDCRRVDWSVLAPVGLAIFGDVLEHMMHEEAAEVIETALAHAPLVLISIPVARFPQEATDSNPYEAHVKDDWNHYEVMRTFPAIAAFFIHGHIGVYLLTGNERLNRQVIALQQVVPKLVRSRHPDDRMAWGGWQIENHL